MKFTKIVKTNGGIKCEIAATEVEDALYKLAVLEEFEEKKVGINLIKFFNALLNNKRVWVPSQGVCMQVTLTGVNVIDKKLYFVYNRYFSTPVIFFTKKECEKFIKERESKKCQMKKS